MHQFIAQLFRAPEDGATVFTDSLLLLGLYLSRGFTLSP